MKNAKIIMIRTLYSLGLLLISTALSLGATALDIDKEIIIMILLLGVLITVVITRGYVYGIVSSFISILLFNYIFTEPIYAFSFDRDDDLILLGFFVAMTIVVGLVTSRLFRQIEISKTNEQAAQLLAKASAEFLNMTGEKNIIMQGVSFIREHTGLDSNVVMNSKGASSLTIANKEKLASKPYPISDGKSVIGTLQVYVPNDGIRKTDELVVRTVVTQIQMALERENIYEERENIRIAMEREQLRSTLLRSVAHDLRSPLTALSGASTLLADDFDKLTDEERKRLALDVSEEMVWLSNLVENILNMTRINEEQLVIHKDDEVIDDIIGEAVGHMKRLLRDRPFNVILPQEVITVPMDGRLIVQVLINLLDNAVKHTLPNEPITLLVEQLENQVKFTVSDLGAGIDNSVKDTLFEGFVTSDHGISDGKRGIGLGLAICKTFIKAHGGKIYAQPNSPKGARFSFYLPLEDKHDQGN
ncbi:MAG: ATP-binding protein [Candidatus Izemoplasmatales bacterium]|nr:ATP-binding protein [Candidatus Izemoplasmatales bacterium]MDD3865324.1 ATP-binding protein [Candidatus Izemoplasmatales bacterium]